MKKRIIVLFLIAIAVFMTAFEDKPQNGLSAQYEASLTAFCVKQQQLADLVAASDVNDTTARKNIILKIAACRRKLKAIDIWLRYLDPNAYRLVNGPLPVEWETEVFEKWEKPYRKLGAGLTVAELYLAEEHIQKDSLQSLLQSAREASALYATASMTDNVNKADVFFLANRLHLLNLAAIYTTGFECPDPQRIIPELENMLKDMEQNYKIYNLSFKDKQLSADYLSTYEAAIRFVSTQPKDYTSFDHFTFIRDYINPLFAMNQQFIADYGVVSRSNLDYALTEKANSIFDKSLYLAQDTKGIYSHVNDALELKELDSIGKLLFFDPILSGNNQRSCASCHKAEEFLTDTGKPSSLQFNAKEGLPRNTASLLNVAFNHLIMEDGSSLTLLHQGKAVMSNPIEMGGREAEILSKVLDCKVYKTAFTKFLKYTPQEESITMEHIVSAISLYYGKYSSYYAPFDHAINEKKDIDPEAKKGFNLFMGKAQCATCHFPPTFSGIKPPFIGNEFEVIGVPADITYKQLSNDKGRYNINPARETLNAFRTSTVRNTANTKPYMHNGVFKTLEEVINFYNLGGGAGHKLKIDNQTLSSDSLCLTQPEKKQLISFIKSLSENVKFDSKPISLPLSKNKELNKRKVGGIY